jgi:hypothetical protein
MFVAPRPHLIRLYLYMECMGHATGGTLSAQDAHQTRLIHHTFIARGQLARSTRLLMRLLLFIVILVAAPATTMKLPGFRL